MKSRELKYAKRMEKTAGLPIRTDRRTAPELAENGIGVARKKKRAVDDEAPLKKTGERREVRATRAWEHSVRRLLENHPEHFRAFVSLVQGRAEEVTDRQLRDLRKWGYLAR